MAVCGAEVVGSRGGLVFCCGQARAGGEGSDKRLLGCKREKQCSFLYGKAFLCHLG